MKADELWEKYKHNFAGFCVIGPDAFESALKEYGKHVKAEAVKVCDSHSGNINQLAAAISKMELP